LQVKAFATSRKISIPRSCQTSQFPLILEALSRCPFWCTLFRLPGLPEIHLGDDLAGQIANAARKARIHSRKRRYLVIAQKIVSKAEGAVVRLATIALRSQAQAIAERQKKDPRLVE